MTNQRINEIRRAAWSSATRKGIARTKQEIELDLELELELEMPLDDDFDDEDEELDEYYKTGSRTEYSYRSEGFNIYDAPIMHFITEFNDVAYVLEEEAPHGIPIDFYTFIDLVNFAREVGAAVSDNETEYNVMRETANELDHVVSLLNDVATRIDEEGGYGDTVHIHFTQEFYKNFEAIYTHFFRALNILKKLAKYDQYVLNIMSPDELFRFDDELLVGAVSDMNDNTPIPDLYRHHDRQNAGYSHSSEHQRLDHKSVKHNLSITQLQRAYEKVVKRIRKSGSGRILANVLFSGVSKWELDALVEEGLVRRSGNIITLGRREDYSRDDFFRF